MATVEAGHTNGNGGLTAAQKLMQKHEAQKPTIEEVPDEADLKHPEPPHSSSVLEERTEDDAAVPTWAAPMSSKAAGKQKEPTPSAESKKPALDTQSQDHFPGLGGSNTKSSVAPPTWGAAKPATANGKVNGTDGTNGTSTPISGTATPTLPGQVAPRTILLPGHTRESIKMKPDMLLPRNQLKKPITELLKDINKKSKANVTMSQGESGSLIFNSTGPADAARKAIQDVAASVGCKITQKDSIPRSARAHIIGKQGSNIKALQEKTRCRIQIPKQDDIPGMDDDDSMVDIVFEGDAVAIVEAKKEISKIVNDRAPSSSTKVRGVPAEFYPFINSRADALEAKGVQVRVPSHHIWKSQPPPQEPAEGQAPRFLPAPADVEQILLAGDRSAVQDARAEIEALTQELHRQLTLRQLSIGQNRHQFIIGDRGVAPQDFFSETGCAIILPGSEDDDEITIVGPADQVEAAVERAMDLATSMQSLTVDISRLHRSAPGGASSHATNVTRYLRQRREIERLEKLHKTHIVTPMSQGVAAPWEVFARDPKSSIRTQQEINNIIGSHPPQKFANVNVDPFYHLHLDREIAPKLRQEYGVNMVVPEKEEADVPVLLVFEGPEGFEPEYQVPSSKPSTEQIRAFQQGLEEARKYVMDLIKTQEDIKVESIDVAPMFHEKLRKFIKSEQAKRSSDEIPVRASNTGTFVNLRGPSSGVDSLMEKVAAFVEQAKADEKERGYTMSFDFPQKHANQLIGKGGSFIRDLREKFDVEIQVDNGQVELKGPKAKAEAAKSHITALGKQWADEATYILKVEPKYHRELIGAGGSQINRLQDRYKVQIHFPRSARPVKDDQSVADAASEAGGRKGPRKDQEPDEVVVKGPKKGADEAREEILSLLQYLKDNSFTATVSVQQSQIPSLIGQRGSGMDELRQTTGAKIDIPNARDVKDPSGRVDITVKGTKSQVAQAKKILEEKKTVFDQTITKTIEVDKKHHRALIGAGGATLRDIVVKAGGPEDRREQARTVQFPKAENDGNSIKIEGSADVVEKIIAAMQAITAQKDSQTSESIDVATDKHRSLIGRGGETKKNLEAKFNVSIDIPRQGSGQTGIKIVGQPADVEKAKTHILDLVKDQEGETVQVPKNIHHTISDNGQFFRQLRNNYQVTVDHAGSKLPPKPSTPATRANGGAMPLITDDADADAHSWNVIGNAASDLDGEIPWILRGSPENIAKARAQLAAAMEQAQKNTHRGYLVLSDPSTYRYVIGQGGSKVNSIRKQSGCKITVPRDQANEAIVVEGSEDGCEKARELILKAVAEGSAPRS
ncbi:hypothetical protein BP6252_06371 [Coleophoma cylindrospora]|uniref:K Homology domain-containing protein n=1 Tax=Coleophoma cylindrospora TaxID=1849047 RepID=A0A3D8RMF2_9HELO|nr:hypothetical protein BP6252_06371 [Coleophoma cylindrospora]